jgi:hypothetical protein
MSLYVLMSNRFKIIDPFLLEHLVVGYSEYNADVSPPVENPDGLEMRLSQSRVTMIRGNADRFPCLATSEPLCNFYNTDQWKHVAFTWNCMSIPSFIQLWSTIELIDVSPVSPNSDIR